VTDKKANKIIHIPRRFVKDQWGGMETLVLELSKGLIEKGYDVEIHTTLTFSDKREEVIYGLPVRRYPSFYTYI